MSSGKVPLFTLRSILVMLALLGSLHCKAVAGDSPADGGQVVVYYFHSTVRCETCLFIEAMAEGTLQAHFAEELKKGALVWLPLNVDRPENATFLSDFHLQSNELVVVRQRRGEAKVWEKIPEIWNLAADPARFSQHLHETVSANLVNLRKKAHGAPH